MPSELEAVLPSISSIAQRPAISALSFQDRIGNCIGQLLRGNPELLPYEKSISNTIRTGTLLLSSIPPHVFIRHSKGIFEAISMVASGRTYDSINLPHYLPHWPVGIEKCKTRQIDAPCFRGSVIDLETVMQEHNSEQTLTISLGGKDPWRDGEPEIKLPDGTSITLIINGKIKIKGSGRRACVGAWTGFQGSVPTLWP